MTLKTVSLIVLTRSKEIASRDARAGSNRGGHRFIFSQISAFLASRLVPFSCLEGLFNGDEQSSYEARSSMMAVTFGRGIRCRMNPGQTSCAFSGQHSVLQSATAAVIEPPVSVGPCDRSKESQVAWQCQPLLRPILARRSCIAAMESVKDVSKIRRHVPLIRTAAS